MSRKGTSSSKFGHLFGDTSDSSSASTSQSRLAGSGDLYRDPLAALVPPITATTTTTRTGATAVKATLSPPPASSSAAAAAAAATVSAQSSPPGSGPNSRSSSRLQHHALFSSLTGDASGSSLFDSAAPPSSTLSATKRDLLFGEGSNGGSSSSRRTSTPPLSRNGNSGVRTSVQQSSRVSSPQIGGVRVTTATVLDTDDSPLGLPLGDNNSVGSSLQEKEDDVLSVKSPLAGEPLTRTNSQASTKSYDSVKSSRSTQPLDTVEGTRPTASWIGGGNPPAKLSSGAASTSSARSASVRRISVDQQPKQAAAMSVVTDPIFNPLAHSQQPQSVKSPSSVSSSQSIDTFQSISRAASPIVPPLSFSKSGFGRDDTSPTPVSKSRAPVNVAILDDAAEAFAKDLLFTSGPSESITTSAVRSSSFLDSGFNSSMPSSSSSMHSSSTAATTASLANMTTTTNTGVALSKPGVSASNIGQAKSISGFSLGEDAADSSNPWMNSLADSLERTNLTRESSTIDYTQSDTGSGFTSDAAFTLPSAASSTINSSRTTMTTTAATRPISRMPMPPLDEDVGGFNDVFSSPRSAKGGNNSAASSLAAPPSSNSRFPSSTLQEANAPDAAPLKSWNVLDAIEAAAHDPDFQGPRSLVNQSAAKVLEIMQMPKDPLEKDVSAQEVFDNPWE